MAMVAREEEWVADRARLRQVMGRHPDWSHRQCAEELGRSIDWVKDWRKRLAAAPPDDEMVLHSRSRARQHPPPPFAPAGIERVLAIRDAPPENLRRTPGPRAILYDLHRDADLQARGERLPRASSTIWRILTEHGRIVPPRHREHEPVERPEPYTSWQLDFKKVWSNNCSALPTLWSGCVRRHGCWVRRMGMLSGSAWGQPSPAGLGAASRASSLSPDAPIILLDPRLVGENNPRTALHDPQVPLARGLAEADQLAGVR
jgi:hypothetical protein